MRISLSDALECVRLVEECAELWDDPEAWQDHLTVGLERLIGGQGGTFAMSRLEGSRVKVTEGHFSSTDAGMREAFWRFVSEGAFAKLPEIELITPVILAKRKLVYQQRDLVSKAESAEFFAQYLRMPVDNGLSGVLLTPDGVFVGAGLQRIRGEREFTQRDHAVLEFILMLVAPRLGSRLTLRSQDGRHGLSPRQRETLDALLDGANEKEVAIRLGISRNTAHDHVLALYRRFGVRSRAQLLAHFARRRLTSKGSAERPRGRDNKR